MTQLHDSNDLTDTLNSTAKKLHNYLENEDPKNIVFIGILTNGVFFSKRIRQKLIQLQYNIAADVMELDISLYRDDFGKNKNYISISSSSISTSLDDKHVVLFDDVLSTGRTARAALNAIFDYGRPKKVSFVVLYDRENREVPIEPNIIGAKLQADNSLRVNVRFTEVHGEDCVMLEAFDT